VTVAMPGDFGKPRPALVIQSRRLLQETFLTEAPVEFGATHRSWLTPSPLFCVKIPSYSLRLSLV
jgi:hypothetical protein